MRINDACNWKLIEKGWKTKMSLKEQRGKEGDVYKNKSQQGE
jgi:hypothetical protein